MNSLIEDKEIPNSEFPQQLTASTKAKLLNKSYTFFIYYRVIGQADQKLTTLEKLSFRLKQQKMQSSDKYLQNSQAKNDKIVNMFFVGIENQNQLQSSFLDLKFQIVQNKTKIILLGYESDMVYLIDKTQQFGINIKSIPFAIYSPHLNDQLAIFLGWSQQNLGNLAQKTPDQLSFFANQWISSPTQKIDVWEINFKVKQNGKISKLVYDSANKNYFLKQFDKTLQKKDYFMSHFSVGYHSKMFMQFQSSKKIQETSFFDKLKFGFQGFKKFCCVGKQSMKSSTGIINISFKDEKNGQMEIMKQFYDQQSLQGQLVQQKKYKHNRKVLSIVLSNIDTYYGKKFPSSRMNDNKVQLISFQSQNQFHKIGSIGGEIKIKFQTEQEVCIKIGNSFFILDKPLQAIIKPYTKMRAMINKQNVEC